MKILFIARHFTYFRNYETVIAELARRGHRLHLAAEREEDLGGREMVERLAREHESVTFGWVPGRDDGWAAFATKLRMTLDYLRYLDPAYAGAPRLRARARERVPRIGLWLVAAAGAHTAPGRTIARAVPPGVRAGHSAQRRHRRVSSRAAARRSVVHAAHRRRRVAAARLPAVGPGARVSDGAVRLELGPPFEQGDSAHHSGPRVRLERHATA